MMKNYRTSRLELAPITVGAMRLGIWGAGFNTQEYERFIDECLDLGLTDFDHADIYGSYTTEFEFGEVIKRRPDLKNKIQVITKCGIKIKSENRPQHNSKSYDSTPEHIIKSVDRSLKNLGTDKIDLLLLHRPDLLMDPKAIADTFEALKSNGKVLHFGVSNFSVSQFEMVDKYFKLFTNQLEISLFHLDAFYDGTIDQCITMSIRPTAWSPLGGGKYFNDPKMKNHQALTLVLNEMATNYGVSISQIMFSWLFKHPARIIPITGTSKISRIREAKKSLEVVLSNEHWYQLLEAASGKEVA
jgi:predicted oxidoreductase